MLRAIVRSNPYKLFMALVLGFFVFIYAGYRFNSFIIEAAYVTNAPAHADAIIVLTGGKGRVDEGLRMLRGGVADTLILSGVHADAGMDAIFAGGVEPQLRKRIILEKSSKNTYENAVETRRLVIDKGFKSIVLLTSWYHLKRAEHIFRTVMPKDFVIVACAVAPPDPEETYIWNFKTMAILASEFIKYWWYAATV